MFDIGVHVELWPLLSPICDCVSAEVYPLLIHMSSLCRLGVVLTWFVSMLVWFLIDLSLCGVDVDLVLGCLGACVESGADLELGSLRFVFSWCWFGIRFVWRWDSLD